MRLTPDDIVNYPLKQSVRGYNVAQVDALLDQIADQLHEMATELEETHRRLDRAQGRLAEAAETEATLKRTLIAAQRAAEQSVGQARTRATELRGAAEREAETLLEEARLEAEELRVAALKAARAEEKEIRERRRELRQQVEALRVFERDYRARLRELLDEQLHRLDETVATGQPSLPGTEPDGTEPDADGATGARSDDGDHAELGGAPVGSASDDRPTG